MIEWAMWANEQGILSSQVILMGGAIGVAGFFKGWEIGIYGIIVGLLVFLVEYPRGKRRSGRTVERSCQKPFSKFVNLIGPVGRNYFSRFVIYLALCVPLCFILATLMGGVCLFFTSCIYLVAALKGEEWLAVGLDVKEGSNSKDVKSFRQPRRPPPRLNQERTADNRV